MRTGRLSGNPGSEDIKGTGDPGVSSAVPSDTGSTYFRSVNAILDTIYVSIADAHH